MLDVLIVGLLVGSLLDALAHDNSIAIDSLEIKDAMASGSSKEVGLRRKWNRNTVFPHDHVRICRVIADNGARTLGESRHAKSSMVVVELWSHVVLEGAKVEERSIGTDSNNDLSRLHVNEQLPHAIRNLHHHLEIDVVGDGVREFLNVLGKDNTTGLFINGKISHLHSFLRKTRNAHPSCWRTFFRFLN